MFFQSINSGPLFKQFDFLIKVKNEWIPGDQKLFNILMKSDLKNVSVIKCSSASIFSIWTDFGRQVGRENGAKIDQKSIQKGIEKMIKKRVRLGGILGGGSTDALRTCSPDPPPFYTFSKDPEPRTQNNVPEPRAMINCQCTPVR